MHVHIHIHIHIHNHTYSNNNNCCDCDCGDGRLGARRRVTPDRTVPPAHASAMLHAPPNPVWKDRRHCGLRRTRPRTGPAAPARRFHARAAASLLCPQPCVRCFALTRVGEASTNAFIDSTLGRTTLAKTQQRMKRATGVLSGETPSCLLYPAVQWVGVMRDGQRLPGVRLRGFTSLVPSPVLFEAFYFVSDSVLVRFLLRPLGSED